METGEPVGGTSLADLGDRQVRMVTAPLVTVTELAIEAVGTDLGSPSPWVAAVRSALQPADRAMLSLSFGPGTPAFVPDAVLPVPECFAAGFDDEAERVLDESADGLAAEIHTAGLAPEPPWSYVAEGPQRHHPPPSRIGAGRARGPRAPGKERAGQTHGPGFGPAAHLRAVAHRGRSRGVTSRIPQRWSAAPARRQHQGIWFVDSIA